MKKIVILVVVVMVAIAGWAGATYFAGSQIEQTHDQLFEKYAKLGPISLSVEDYQRGFAQSTARVVMEIMIPKPEPAKKGGAADEPVEPVRLVFEEAIKHGPVPGWSGLGLATIETRLIDVSPNSEKFATLQAETPALKGVIDVTRIDFDGTLHSVTRIPKIHAQIDDATIDWDGLTMNVTWSQTQKTLVGDFDLAVFKVDAKDGRLTWDGAKGEMDLVETLPLLYVGKTRASIGTMDLDFLDKTSGQHQQFTLRGVEMSAASAYEGSVVNLTEELKFAGLDAQGQSYGPGVLDFEMRNFDGQVMSDFQQRASELYGSAETFTPKEMAAQLFPLYQEVGIKLLEKSPELNIRKLQFLTPKGKIEGSLQVKYDGSQGVNTNAPMTMIQAVDVKADLGLHEDLVKLFITQNVVTKMKQARTQGQIPDTFTDEKIEELARQQVDSQIEGVLAQNLAVRDGEMIRSNATFKQGELVVNGQNLPIFQ